MQAISRFLTLACCAIFVSCADSRESRDAPETRTIANPRVTRINLETDTDTNLLDSTEPSQRRTFDQRVKKRLVTRSIGSGRVSPQNPNKADSSAVVSVQVFNNPDHARVEGSMQLNCPMVSSSSDIRHISALSNNYIEFTVSKPSRYLIAYTTSDIGNSATLVSMSQKNQKIPILPGQTALPDDALKSKRQEENVLTGDLIVGRHILSFLSNATGAGSFSHVKISVVVTNK